MLLWFCIHARVTRAKEGPASPDAPAIARIGAVDHVGIKLEAQHGLQSDARRPAIVPHPERNPHTALRSGCRAQQHRRLLARPLHLPALGFEHGNVGVANVVDIRLVALVADDHACFARLILHARRRKRMPGPHRQRQGRREHDVPCLLPRLRLRHGLPHLVLQTGGLCSRRRARRNGKHGACKEHGRSARTLHVETPARRPQHSKPRLNHR
jgi:hypothetical protein